MNKLRFKRRSDLQNFADKYPGALAAHLLLQIRLRVHGGQAEKQDHLYSVDPTVWASRESHLKDTRDIKEMLLLTHLLMLLNQKKIERIADVIAMRVRELRFAKTAGQSWEKAEVVSLTPSSLPGTTAVPDLAMSL